MASTNRNYDIPSMDNSNPSEGNASPSSSTDYSSVIDSSLTHPGLTQTAVAAQLAASNANTASDRISKPAANPLRKHLHIRSEQRRRERITDGFSQLRNVVPTIRSGYDSKALVLKKSAEYIETLEYEVGLLKTQLVAIENFYKHAVNEKEGQKGKPSEGENTESSNAPEESAKPSHPVEQQPAMYPPVYAFQPGFIPPPMNMYSMVGQPIIGAPIGHQQGVGRPSPNLMHPTVPYYFASDFQGNKDNKSKEQKETKGDSKTIADEDVNNVFAVAVASQLKSEEGD